MQRFLPKQCVQGICSSSSALITGVLVAGTMALMPLSSLAQGTPAAPAQPATTGQNAATAAPDGTQCDAATFLPGLAPVSAGGVTSLKTKWLSAYTQPLHLTRTPSENKPIFSYGNLSSVSIAPAIGACTIGRSMPHRSISRRSGHMHSSCRHGPSHRNNPVAQRHSCAAPGRAKEASPLYLGQGAFAVRESYIE